MNPEELRQIADQISEALEGRSIKLNGRLGAAEKAIAIHDKALYGDREDPARTPGIIHDFAQIKGNIESTRKIAKGVLMIILGLLASRLWEIILELRHHP